MDEPTAAALLDERLTHSTEALALEVIALRSLIDALMNNLNTLRAHITTTAITSMDRNALAAGAGGMAAIECLDKWLMESLTSLNDVTAAAGREYPHS